MTEGGPAVVTYHGVLNDRAVAVRKYRVSAVRPYAQYDRSVTVSFTEPRKRAERSWDVTPDDSHYVTVEVGGVTVYDSRSDVPCDMDVFNAARARVAAARRD